MFLPHSPIIYEIFVMELMTTKQSPNSMVEDTNVLYAAINIEEKYFMKIREQK